MQTNISVVDSLFAGDGPAIAPHNDVEPAGTGKPFKQLVEDASAQGGESEPKADNVVPDDEVRARELDKDRSRPEPPAATAIIKG